MTVPRLNLSKRGEDRLKVSKSPCFVVSVGWAVRLLPIYPHSGCRITCAINICKQCVSPWSILHLRKCFLNTKSRHTPTPVTAALKLCVSLVPTTRCQDPKMYIPTTTVTALLLALPGLVYSQTPPGFTPSTTSRLEVTYGTKSITTPGTSFTKAGQLPSPSDLPPPPASFSTSLFNPLSF